MVPFGGPHNKDYSILGSILGSPYFWETTIYIYIHIHMYRVKLPSPLNVSPVYQGAVGWASKQSQAEYQGANMLRIDLTVFFRMFVTGK